MTTLPLPTGRVLRRLRGDHPARVEAARRRAHSDVLKGEPARALVTLHEALKNLPAEGEMPPHVYAELHVQLLADRSAALSAVAEEVYRGRSVHGTGRRPRWRPRARTGRLAAVVSAVLAVAVLAAAGRWAARHFAGAWTSLAPVAIAFGAVATVLATLTLLGPPHDGTHGR